MKISVEKSCSVVFSRYKKENDNLNLKIYGNIIVSQKEIKFLGLGFILSKNGVIKVVQMDDNGYLYVSKNLIKNLWHCYEF
ncbi:hypothetical protein BpHYR1_031944 [Brachionus plicatilis]|uniref:Uncharacterized protein n=1 Tax=Brachionus plicatilis TaxID=10195 RepID=A0A3M7T6V7_BRAPC|nr:hypothetical protein BpHYR1_031944 [Brachionus plicatilis]